MTKVKAIETTDGQIFKDLNEAKKHELELVLGKGEEPAAQLVMDNAEKILNILTMKASSHPSARKANGAAPRKPRAKKSEPQPTLPGTSPAD